VGGGSLRNLSLRLTERKLGGSFCAAVGTKRCGLREKGAAVLAGDENYFSDNFSYFTVAITR